MNLNYLISIVALLLAIAVMLGFNMQLPGPAGFAAKVAVEIYRHDESGEMIYCESGDLNDEFHTYMGSGTIDGDKAVAC